MPELISNLKTSIAKKGLMAFSGLLLATFLITHLLGNSMTFFGREAFDNYAERLHTLGLLILVFETGLFVVFLIHVYFGLTLFFENLGARPNRYDVRNSAGGRTFGSKTMPYTGLLILVFIFHHLAKFHFGDHGSASDLVLTNLSEPVSAIYYIISLLALTLHTSHGFWSMFQTMGLSHPKYDLLIYQLALAASIIIGTVFIMIPILALFWPKFLG